MKRTNKLIVALSIIFTILAIGVMSYATGVDDILDKMTGNAATEGTTAVTGLGDTIFTIVRVGGIVVAVIILVVLGIKYMVGSAEEKAEYKKTMIPYIIGAILIAASTQIVGIIGDVAKSIK